MQSATRTRWSLCSASELVEPARRDLVLPMISDLAPYQQKDLVRLREYIPHSDAELADMNKVQLSRILSSARNSCSMEKQNLRRQRIRQAYRDGEIRNRPFAT